MNEPRVPLYKRLPEIYRIKDQEQANPGQLQSYLALVEDVFSAIHENIEQLYRDLFIETCDEWVIPYIGDLLGTSHLSGDPWTLRADVADTIALRRRKGTLGAIELLTYNLSKWGVHCLELRENLVWNQHLNHQRPDEGGQPPYSLPGVKRQTPIRGGTVTLRDPSILSLLATPFDPFAHTADLKPPAIGTIRYNVPNLAIFLWRLAAYRVRVTKPIFKGAIAPGPPAADHVVRFSINPVDRPYIAPGNEQDKQPVRLFNTNLVDITNTRRTGPDSLDNARLAPSINQVDETPGPIPLERLSEGPAGAPDAYVSVETYDATSASLAGLVLSDVGFQLHLPDGQFSGETLPPPPGQPAAWKIRGANLCAWETGLEPALENQEIAIDPIIGRIAIGVATAARATALENDLLITHTYGAVGPVGAQPISRPLLPAEFTVPPNHVRHIDFRVNPHSLVEALNDVHITTEPIVIEIDDSMTYVLDLTDPTLVEERLTEDGGPGLKLNRSLVIRAADNQRPVIELAQPLRFRPANVSGASPQQQNEFDALMSTLTVRLEGLYLTRGENFPAGEPLIARAALNRLEIIGCTLDPGGFKSIHGDRTSIFTSMRLKDPYGFTTDAAEESAFNQIPEIIVSRSIAGPLLIDPGYRLDLTDSVIDAGQGGDDQADKFAVTQASDPNPLHGWGPATRVSGVTVFGRMRVESVDGSGGIWVHALEAMNNQIGCIKFSYVSGEAEDRLPPNHGCVKGTEAVLRFNSEIFGEPAYGQLALSSDFRIRERGPNDDAMGAFGFLLEAHKWRNLQIRYREFMPVGIRPLLIPVT